MKYILFCLSLLLLHLSIAHADTAAVASFVVSPSSGGSGSLISLTWTGQNTSGYNLSVDCVGGVKIKNQDGALFPCGSKMATSGGANDSMGLVVVNTSGVSKFLTFRLYPKDLSGAENTSGERDQSMTIYTSPYPLSFVYASATSTTQGKPTTISWSGLEIDGVNIMVSCMNNVSITSSVDGLVMPCGQVAFTNKLGVSGSIDLTFTNRNLDRVPVTVTVLPYISDGAYDLIHAQSVTLDVPSNTITSPQIVSFTASKATLASDDTLVLSWSTKYTPGVNIKMMCTDFVTMSLTTGTSTQPLPCNTFFSSDLLNPNATTSLTLYNSSLSTQNVKFTLYPQFGTGGYDGINTQSIFVSLVPKGSTIGATTSSQVTSVSTTTTVSTQNFSGAHYTFSRTLSLGSQNADVAALQKFLAKDKTLYPEGLVTGYMGPATVRAIQRFQVKYALTKAGVAGYGLVGPATRAKLNVVQ